jgi:hypothetical protein
MTTPILQITEVADGQTLQYVTYNDALRLLEQSCNDFLSVDLSSSDGTVTNASPNYDMLRYGVFRTTGNTVARTLTFSAQKRSFVVDNTGSAALDVIIGSTTISVPATTAYRFYADGTTNGLVRVQ